MSSSVSVRARARPTSIEPELRNSLSAPKMQVSWSPLPPDAAPPLPDVPPEGAPPELAPPLSVPPLGLAPAPPEFGAPPVELLPPVTRGPVAPELDPSSRPRSSVRPPQAKIPRAPRRAVRRTWVRRRKRDPTPGKLLEEKGPREWPLQDEHVGDGGKELSATGPDGRGALIRTQLTSRRVKLRAEARRRAP